MIGVGSISSASGFLSCSRTCGPREITRFLEGFKVHGRIFELWLHFMFPLGFGVQSICNYMILLDWRSSFFSLAPFCRAVFF